MNAAPLVVATPSNRYEVLVGAGILDDLARHLDALGLLGQLWLISDSAVYPRYGAALEQALGAAGRSVRAHVVPAGEPSKSLEVVAGCYDWLIGGGVERRDAVLALGGGVVGDLAGFVAATVLRGVALVQLPTTLLAMVDSAIGGKTGVNHSLGKNLIGAFHQPRLVLSDTQTLASLPPRELRAGWAEVIKHATIRDQSLFERLEQAVDEGQKTSDESSDPSSFIFRLSSDSLADLIRQAARVKVDVVNADERETGERMLLNYGHTFGHALEAASGYGALLHGEAVAIGMDMAGQIAERLGTWSAADLERQRRLLRAYGLATEAPSDVLAEQLLQLVLRDKKVRAGRVRWVLPTGIGQATVRDDVPAELVRQVAEQATTPAAASGTHVA